MSCAINQLHTTAAVADLSARPVAAAGVQLMLRLLVALLIVVLGPGQLHAAPAKRIAALAPHTVEMLFAIGAGEQIIATVDYADHPQQARTIPRVGGHAGVQLDRLLQLQPDLVVVWRGGNRMEDIQRLEKLGFKLFFSEPGTLDHIADELEQLGQLTGNQAKAEEVAAAFRKRLDDLRHHYQSQIPVRLFYEMWPRPMMTVSAESWIHQLIDTCGGDNLFADATTPYPQISIEAVLLKAPDLIITPYDHNAPKDSGVDWRRWPQIPAVKNGQLASLNADLLHRYSPRILEGVEALCQTIDAARQQLAATQKINREDPAP